MRRALSARRKGAPPTLSHSISHRKHLALFEKYPFIGTKCSAFDLEGQNSTLRYV